MGQPKVDNFRRDLLTLKYVGLDSMCFIYQFSEHPLYCPLTNILITLLEERKIYAITSTITITEVFIQPERIGDQLIIHEYEQFFAALPHLEIFPVDWHIARLAAKLRARVASLRTPDALQVPLVLLKNYHGFVTNDVKLSNIPGVKSIILDKYL